MPAVFRSIHEALESGETLVFAHRGAMAAAPMNTLAAFELALTQGAHGIELDVQLSADGHLVIVHDLTVDATTDGSGAVAGKSLAELQELDAGSWFSDQYTGERMPTLSQVFAAMGDRTLINVEIKAGSADSRILVQRIAACIQQFSVQERVIISSFNAEILLKLRQLLPQVLIGFLYEPALPPENYLSLRQLAHEARHPRHDLVDETYMAWARANGYFVNTWTVNDPGRALELQRLGVNAIITDNAKLLLDALSL